MVTGGLIYLQIDKKYEDHLNMNIETLDINLFKALVAIYEERQVTAAADRLGITQPGLSHALARLRELTGDELFVRRPDGMVPTAAAEDLYARVRPGLTLIQEGLGRAGSVDPAKLERTFVLGMNDYGASILLPPLIRRIRLSAPKVRLKTRHFAHGTQYADLRAGNIDLSVTVTSEPPGWTDHEPLFEETAMLVASADNPRIARRANGSVDLATYIACPHIIMAPDGTDRNWVDDLLEDLGQSRTIQHTVPHFLAIPPIIRGTELITTAPRRIAEALAGIEGLAAYELPFDAPKHRIVQVWPKRRQRDPQLTWLRAELRATAAELT